MISLGARKLAAPGALDTDRGKRAECERRITQRKNAETLEKKKVRR